MIVFDRRVDDDDGLIGGLFGGFFLGWWDCCGSGCWCCGGEFGY